MRTWPLIFSAALLANSVHAQVPQPVDSAKLWHLRPEMRIGTAAGEKTSFNAIGDMAVSADGTIFITQPSDGTIRKIAASGKPEDVTVIGGRGRGPGEFEAPYDIGVDGDTVWVTDRSLDRVTFLSREGRYLSSELFRRKVLRNTYLTGPPQFVLGDHSALLVARPLPLKIKSVDRMPILRVTREGTILDTVTWLMGGHPRLTVQVNGRHAVSLPQPFDAVTIWAPDHHGDGIVLVDRTPATDQRHASFVVRRLDADGKSVYSSRIRYRPMPLTASDRDGMVVRLLARSHVPAKEASSALKQRVLQKMWVPDFYPPVMDCILGEKGFVWLRLKDRPGPKSHWVVIDNNGHLAAQLSGPRSLRIYRADAEHVWASELARLRVPVVVRFRIQKPSQNGT